MKTLIVLVLCLAASSAFAQCEPQSTPTHNNFCDVSDLGGYWTDGVEFTAYDVNGVAIGHSPRPSPSRAIRPRYFPLHVYGDDGTTPAVEGPVDGQTFYVHSDIIKNCGRLRTRAPLVFKHWSDVFANFIHPGDVTGDGKINMGDYRVINFYLRLGVYDCKYDVNADGVLDTNDAGLIGRIALYGDVRSTIGKWGYACEEGQ